MYKFYNKRLFTLLTLIAVTLLTSCVHHTGQKSNPIKSSAKIKPQKPYGGTHNRGGILKELRKAFEDTQTTKSPSANKSVDEKIKPAIKTVATNKPISRLKPVKPYSIVITTPQKTVKKGNVSKNALQKPLKPYNNGYIKNKGFWEDIFGF